MFDGVRSACLLDPWWMKIGQFFSQVEANAMLRVTTVVALFFLAAPSSVGFAHGGRNIYAVEPAKGKYALLQDTWAYRGPSVETGELKPVHAGKFVVVTGATPDFVRVRLRDGSVGYVPESAVALFRPADKTFIVSTNTGVYAGPHLESSKLDSVRRGQKIHVIGVELYYLKIRTSNGTEGFIPVAAVE
jgi:hypothetical protein